MTTITEIKQSGKCHIEYNPNGREWLVGYPTGQIVSFAPGLEGRLAATLSALTYDAPELAGQVEVLAKRYPTNKPWLYRLVKAAWIVRKEMVFDALPLEAESSYLNELVRVKSSREESTEYYAVTKTAQGYHCSCRDWSNGRARRIMDPTAPEYPQTGAPAFGHQIYCKHIIAAYLALHTPYTLRPVPVDALDPAEMSYSDKPLTDAEYHELAEMRRTEEC